MDAFRNPKTAAALYASQSDDTNVLEIGSPFDKGDYAGSVIGDVYAFTNADEVRLYKNDEYVTTFKPDRKKWSGLPHPPILINDLIGDLLMTKEGFDDTKAKLIRECLQAQGKFGSANLPPVWQAKVAFVMKKYNLTREDVSALYMKYVENWGGEATRWRFDAVKDGKVVNSTTKRPGNTLHFEVKVGNNVLNEGNTYDMTSVRVKLLDEFGNLASYAQLPVRFNVTGDIELVGPDTVTAEGGMCGTYLKTVGKAGKGVLTITADRVAPVEVSITVNAKRCR
jgi:beta-galactosidase